MHALCMTYHKNIITIFFMVIAFFLKIAYDEIFNFFIYKRSDRARKLFPSVFIIIM